ncbi:MAG: SIS domain-containing protein [Vulcanimicrobiota bacterium]
MENLLSRLEFSDARGQPVPSDEAFADWVAKAVRIRSENRTIYLIGNGASASMASHFAADLAKNGHLHTQVFSDVCLLTAVSNDISFEEVYAEPLRRRARPGDMLIAISSSGASPNILRGVDIAREMGVTIVTLSAFAGDNPLRGRGDLNAYLPATSYGEAETAHATVLHYWMDKVEV